MAIFDITISALRVLAGHYFSASGTGHLQDKLVSHFISVLFTILACNTCPSQKSKASKAVAHLIEVQLAAANVLKSVTQFGPPALRGSILAGLYPLLSSSGGAIGVYSATTCASVCEQLTSEVERLFSLNIYGNSSHFSASGFTKYTPFATTLLTCMWVLQASVHHISSPVSENGEENTELQVPSSMRSVRSYCVSFFTGLLQVI